MDSREGRGDDRFRGESLTELLRSWRRRLDPREVPGLESTGRRGDGLSQRDAAHLGGVSERWYRALEAGKSANYSVEFLDRLAMGLGLSGAERHALYLRATGRPPTLLAAPEPDAAAEMDEQLQQFLDTQPPNPAYVSDVAWNIVGRNQPFRAWFPWAVRDGNLMRWILLDPEARDRLVNWREDWARPALGQIRYALSQYPKNEALRRLERDVLAGPWDMREMWGRREVYEHPERDVRRLRLPYHAGREVPVRTIDLAPARSARLRVVVFMEGRGGASTK